MNKVLDGRGKELKVGDIVAIAPCGTVYAWSECDFGEINNISHRIVNTTDIFVLSFKGRRLIRESTQVLKLEQ